MWRRRMTCSGCLTEIREKYDHLDILVSNAASGVLKPAMELTTRHWNWAMDINARALLSLTQHAVPMMRERRSDNGRVQPRCCPGGP